MPVNYNNYEHETDVLFEEEQESVIPQKIMMSRDLLKQEILLAPNNKNKSKLEFYILIISVMLIVSASWLTFLVMGLPG